MATLDSQRIESALLESAASFHMYSLVAHFHLLRVAHSLLLCASNLGQVTAETQSSSSARRAPARRGHAGAMQQIDSAANVKLAVRVQCHTRLELRGRDYSTSRLAMTRWCRNLHTFSAFWLRSSVVSVLLSLISEIWTICPVSSD